MRYSSRFFLYAPVALLAALAAAAVIHWFVASSALAKYLDQVNGHEIAPGVKLSFAHRQMAGFPFRLDVIADDLRIDVNGAHGPAEWRTEHFAMHMLDYGRVQAIFEAAGKQTITWTGENGAKKRIAFLPALLRASAIDVKGRLSRFDFELIGASASDLQIANLQFHLRRAPDADALDIALDADDVHLGSDFKSAFGNAITKIHLDSKLTPAHTWDGVFSGKTDWRASAENWRNAKGALDIANLELAWGKVDVTGKGTLMLDAMQRPRGILDLDVKGMQYLANRPARGFVSGLLNSIAQYPGDGSGRLPVPLAFKDGVAYIHQTPAGLLDPLYAK